MKQFALTILAGLTLSGLLSANITVTPTPVVTGSTGNFLWSYDVGLSSNETATSIVPGGSCNDSASTICGGTFFTIYDFTGFNGVATTPTDWAFSAQLVGVTPTGQTPDTGDSASVVNLTFYYTGAGITGPADLGDFSIGSIYGSAEQGSYTEQSNSNPSGTREHGGGFTEVPMVGSVPEPGTTGLISLSLIGLAAVRRKFVR